MKTLPIIAAAVTALAFAAPASAQVAFAGDGLFGHHYAAADKEAGTVAERRMSFGYPLRSEQPTVASAPLSRARPAAPKAAAAKAPTSVTPAIAPVPNAF